VKVAWITGECDIRQRTTVHSRVDKGVEQNAGDRNKVVYGISPTDRWTNGENKLGAGTVLKNICQS